MPASRSIADRWKLEGAPARALQLLRVAAWLFSFLALVVMATDVHGRGGANDFSTYPEYRYESLNPPLHHDLPRAIM